MRDLFFLSFIFLILDFLWLNFVVKNIWLENVQNVQKSEMIIKKKYAFISYILIILGLYIFVKKNVSTVKEGFIYGFIYGFILYAVFDFTNLAIFKDFNLYTSILDSLWGGLLSAITVSMTMIII